MRTTIFTAVAILFTLGMVACEEQGGVDDEALTASTTEAITYVDDELVAEGIDRDMETLTDERLLEEAREIATFAEDHGCDVDGVLGGIYLIGEEVAGGTIHGRWFDLEQTIGGDLTGIYTPDEDEAGGIFDGTWESTDGLAGTLTGDYYNFAAGDGSYLGNYDETEGDAAGLLGGLWYGVNDDGGIFFGVWGHCGEGAVEIDPETY